jgi:hypothetical protein
MTREEGHNLPERLQDWLFPSVGVTRDLETLQVTFGSGEDFFALDKDGKISNRDQIPEVPTPTGTTEYTAANSETLKSSASDVQLKRLDTKAGLKKLERRRTQLFSSIDLKSTPPAENLFVERRRSIFGAGVRMLPVAKVEAGAGEKNAEGPLRSSWTEKNSLPRLQTKGLDQETIQEDPEDVKAREEIATINAEFMKAAEPEQIKETVKEGPVVTKLESAVKTVEPPVTSVGPAIENTVPVVRNPFRREPFRQQEVTVKKEPAVAVVKEKQPTAREPTREVPEQKPLPEVAAKKHAPIPPPIITKRKKYVDSGMQTDPTAAIETPTEIRCCCDEGHDYRLHGYPAHGGYDCYGNEVNIGTYHDFFREEEYSLGDGLAW